MNYEADVLPIVRGVRDLLLPHYGKAPVVERKSENAHDVVTDLDRRAELYFKEALSLLDPGAGFYGEEFGGDDTAEVFWLCDPIDGTAHFVRGLPFCTSMLSRVEKGEVVFTAVYDFLNDRLYHAVLGKGAYGEGERLSVSTRTLKEGYVLPETHLEKEENLRRYQALRQASGGMPKFYECGFDFAMIASGRLEARITFDPYGKDWDYAPALLVKEAGGVVANIGKNTYDYKNHDFIAANPIVFKELTEGPDAIFPIL